MKRRTFIKLLNTLGLGIVATKSVAFTKEVKGNFEYIYQSKKLKSQFYNFLVNVFHLFPEDKFHTLIADIVKENSTDKEIYIQVQEKIKSITPSLSVFKYQLPALFHQKNEMVTQTVELLGKGKTFDGYFEIGSNGRYLDYLESKVNIKGKRYYANVKKAGYGFAEMVDRGQISEMGTFLPMKNYHAQFNEEINANSLDLVVVYIGFHHCPFHLRSTFIGAIEKVLRKGGKLILRDHDCHNEDQKRMAALAHDVFNMGTYEPWEYNKSETRNFYSLKFIVSYIEKLGFRYENKKVFQAGDPTLNALMLFTKK